MPNWNQLLDEINAAEGIHDVIRRRYLKEVFEITGRNVIIYYSGWLQKENIAGIEINDEDKNGFMTVIHELDRSRGRCAKEGARLPLGISYQTLDRWSSKRESLYGTRIHPRPSRDAARSDSTPAATAPQGRGRGGARR